MIDTDNYTYYDERTRDLYQAISVAVYDDPVVGQEICRIDIGSWQAQMGVNSGLFKIVFWLAKDGPYTWMMLHQIDAIDKEAAKELPARVVKELREWLAASERVNRLLFHRRTLQADEVMRRFMLIELTGLAEYAAHIAHSMTGSVADGRHLHNTVEHYLDTFSAAAVHALAQRESILQRYANYMSMQNMQKGERDAA